jgi:glutamyl/glutaminyl-tRNA synthetase
MRVEASAGEGLSLASARAALYAWLLARHEEGQVCLYLVGNPELPALAAMHEELRFLGLDWDAVVDKCPAESSYVFGAPGEASPQYVHLPPIEGPEAGLQIGEWIAQGYAGLALVNCLARLGWTPRGKRALLTLDELAKRFELERVSQRPAVFDRKQLDWFNRRWLGGLSAGEVTALLVPHWQAAYGCAERSEGTALSPDQWQETLALAVREELDRPVQAAEKARFAFVDELACDSASRTVLETSYAGQILDAFADDLASVEPFEFDPLDAFFHDLRLRFKGALGIRSRDVMYVLRAALTGRQDGPCLVVVCQLLGPGRSIQRAMAAAREI